MIVNVLVALALGSAVVSLSAAAGQVGLRQSREAFLAAAARGAARAALVAARSGTWVDSTALTYPGRRLAAGISLPKPDIVVTLGAEWLAGDLWLLDGDAQVSDQGGAVRARARTGIIVQIFVNAIDSSRFSRPIGRGWLGGFQ